MLRRNLLPALFTLLSIGLVLFTAWSLDHFRRYQPYAALLADSAFGPRQFSLQLTDVDLRGRSGGMPEWSVHSNRIQLTPDQSSIVVDSLDHGVMMRDAKPYLQFVAHRAVYTLGGASASAAIVQVMGGIHIHSIGSPTPGDAPLAITTSRALWNGYQSMLTLPDEVQVEFARTPSSPGIALDSQSVKWNATSHQLTCPARVQASVESLGSYGPYLVDSDDLVYDEPSGQLRCDNPISVSIPGLGFGTCRPLVLDTRQHTADLGSVHFVADAAAVASPLTPSPAPPPPSAASAKAEPATAASAAPASPHSSAATPADDNTVTFDAPQGWHYVESTRILTVRGPVTFHQGDATMTTVGAIYDHKTDVATSQAPITITDPQTTMKGDSGSIDFKHHIATISGNIHIDVEPKPDKDSDADSESDDREARKPTVMTCDAVDYNYRKKFAITKGTVVIKQQHRTVTADRGTYDTAKQYAELTGNVVADTDDGQHMEADLAKMSLKKGDEWLDVPNPKMGSFKVPDEDNPKPTK